jgi:regulator of replication initiation timing
LLLPVQAELNAAEAALDKEKKQVDELAATAVRLRTWRDSLQQQLQQLQRDFDMEKAEAAAAAAAAPPAEESLSDLFSQGFPWVADDQSWDALSLPGMD